MSRDNESYWWWKEQINNCPICNSEVNLGIDAVSGQYMVCCMNCCCSNRTVFYSKSWRKSNSKLE